MTLFRLSENRKTANSSLDIASVLKDATLDCVGNKQVLRTLSSLARA